MKTYSENIISSIENYKSHLEKRIRFLEKRSAARPDFHLKYTKKGDHIYYCTRPAGRERNPHYISRSDTRLKELVNSNYVSRVLPVLRKNLKAANRFLALHSGTEEPLVAQRLPAEMQRMNHDLFPCRDLLINEWQSRPYQRNPYHPGSLIHATVRGDPMRSKSEAMIADSLHSHGLAYQPERPFRLAQSGRTVYPDFVILHPVTLREVYWEHFGLLDDPEYAANACRRIRELHASGVIVGENLICTFETRETPLSSAMVGTYIKQYFFS